MAALPFEVDLTSELLATLKQNQFASALERRQTVSNVSYMGDEGGILMPHSASQRIGNAIVTSITHIRVPAYLPFAPDVADYQKHRVKKLRKLHSELNEAQSKRCRPAKRTLRGDAMEDARCAPWRDLVDNRLPARPRQANPGRACPWPGGQPDTCIALRAAPSARTVDLAGCSLRGEGRIEGCSAPGRRMRIRRTQLRWPLAHIES